MNKLFVVETRMPMAMQNLGGSIVVPKAYKMVVKIRSYSDSKDLREYCDLEIQKDGNIFHQNELFCRVDSRDIRFYEGPTHE